MKKLFWILVLILGVFLFYNRVVMRNLIGSLNKPDLPSPTAYEDARSNTNKLTTPEPVAEKPAPVNTNTPPKDPTPPKTESAAINLGVPFQSQAPGGDWSLPYKEACEEASAIMVDYYLRGHSLSATEMDQEIVKLANWEAEKGYAIDVSAVELQDIVEAYYKYKTELIAPLTDAAIRHSLQQGRPVIVPVAGRELGNPYYTQPGPLYHVLVIKGVAFDGRYITNDPGTRRGADFLYDPEVLLSAARDWDGDSPDGLKRGLVIYK